MNDDNGQKNLEREDLFDLESETLVNEEKKNSNKAVLLIISLLYLIFQICQYSADYQEEYNRQMEIYNAERELLDHISSAFSYYEYEEEEPFSLTGPQVYVLEESNQIYDSLKLGMTKNEVLALIEEVYLEDSGEREEHLYWYIENGTKCAVDIINDIVESVIPKIYGDQLYHAYCEEKEGMTIEEIIILMGEPDSGEKDYENTYMYWEGKGGIQKACIHEDVVVYFSYDEIYPLKDGVKEGMTKEEVIKLRGEPDSVWIEPAWTSLTWYDENNIKYFVFLQDDIVVSVSRDLESSEDKNIKLSAELGTEIESIKHLVESINIGMEFSEVIKILGTNYVDVHKEEYYEGEYYCKYIWYDKLENSIEIAFDESGDSLVINSLTRSIFY